MAMHSKYEKISHNFRYYEIIKSETAERLLIDNNIYDDEIFENVRFLTLNILQPVRDHFSTPFSPNSVYRCQKLERALKGKPWWWKSKSQHVKGQACDIEIPRIDNYRLAKWIANNLNFDQLILECYTRGFLNSGWVHVSIKRNGKNRRQLLSYVRDRYHKRYVYVNGLVR